MQIKAGKLNCFKGPVYLLLSGGEEVLSDAPGVKSGNQPQVQALNDTFLYGNNLSQARVYLQGSPKEATEVQGHLEDPAKVLFILHQDLCLKIRATEGIVKNFPKKEINI